MYGKMKKTLFSLASIALFMFSFTLNVDACTNYLVTKKASTDGSTMVTYAADSHALYGELYFWAATDWAEGSMLKVYEWDTGKYLGEIPQVKHTYRVIGNMNENQVTIGETTYGGRSELSMARDGQLIDYGSLIYITLQRSKTAREAIKVMTNLVKDYGYYSSGESFSIADANEVWILEMIGKGGTYKLEKSSLKAIKSVVSSTVYKAISKNIINKEFLTQKSMNEAVKKEIKTAESSLSDDKIDELVKEIAKHTNVKWNQGAVWVARMIPDGYISGHANQARITTFPWNDDPSSISSDEMDKLSNKNVTTVYAADVMSFAKEKGFINDKVSKETFSFSDTYAPVDFGGARFCDMRVWTFFNRVAGGMDKYWEYAKGTISHDEQTGYANNRMPLWIKPDKKVSPREVMDAMRDHLEGTELDMSKDAGAGPFGLPYRWRPMTWEVDGETYVHERATGTQQTAFSFVAQMRNWLPNAIGGINWFGVDNASTTVYVPFYAGMLEVPETYAVGNGDFNNYSENSAFWVFSKVSNFTYLRWSDMYKDVRKLQNELEEKFLEYVPAIDAAAKLLYDKNQDLALNFLTDYSVSTANNTVYRWEELFQYLLVKYIDGNIKKEKDGKFMRNQYGNPSFPNQPKYDERFYRMIIKDHGDKIKMPNGGGH